MDQSEIQRRAGRFLLCCMVPGLVAFQLLLLLPVAAVGLICVSGVVVVATRPDFPRRAKPPPDITPGPGWRDRFAMWMNANMRPSTLVFGALLSIVPGLLALFRGSSSEFAIKVTLSTYLGVVVIGYGLARWLRRYGLEYDTNPHA